jgi:Acetyltransferase (GNAT) family.
MELISVTAANIQTEHICCAISNNNDIQVISKKEWLKTRFDEGLVFLKANVKGKCFIEFIPAEKAWCPIEASGYMFINCFWVSGQYKGHGYSNELLNACIDYSKAQNKNGLVILSAKKKMPFLSDPSYLKYKGFQLADTCNSYYELLYLPFQTDSNKPNFMEHAKAPKIEQSGFVLYYSNQCPFTAKYVPLIEQIALKKQLPFQSIHLQTTKEARKAPAPFTTYSLFYNGVFVTNEILSEKKFEKLCEKLCGHSQE